MPRANGYNADPHTPDVLHAIRNNKVDYFFAFPKASSQGKDPDNAEQRLAYQVRRAAVDHAIPILTNFHVAEALIEALGAVSRLDTKSYQDIMAEMRAD